MKKKRKTYKQKLDYINKLYIQGKIDLDIYRNKREKIEKNRKE